MNGPEEKPRGGPSRRSRPGGAYCRLLYLLLLLAAGAFAFSFIHLERSAFVPCSGDKLPPHTAEDCGSSSRLRLLAFPLASLFDASAPPAAADAESYKQAADVMRPAISNPAVAVEERRLIIAVTPTYVRAAQAPHFVQMVNVLRVVPPPLLWIVVEAEAKTEETALLLERTAGNCIHVGSFPMCTTVNYTHIASKLRHENHAQSRGVIQRNAAIEYIETNQISGVVYFMDDDNVYSPQLFQEMRKIRKVGVWPVGFLWSWIEQQNNPNRQFRPFVERPLVRKDLSWEHVIGWETFEWAARTPPGQGRKYHTDMAGFAFNSELLWTPKNKFSGRPNHPVRFHSRSAWIETDFLDRLVVSLAELEPLADSCRDVLVWHTKMEARKIDPYPLNWHLPQPSGFVADTNLSARPRYVIRRRAYKLANYSSNIPFGYRDVSVPLRLIPNPNTTTTTSMNATRS